MKQDYPIVLTGRVCNPTPTATMIHTNDLPAPTPCTECGRYATEDEQVEQLGREFAELLYCHVDGRFWDGMQKYIKEKRGS